MRHRVDDVIHADADAQRGIFFGIAAVVGPFPGIADIVIESMATIRRPWSS